MALGLATLTLLASLFLVVHGVLNAPEALASCPERTWCDPLFLWETDECCCSGYWPYWHKAWLLQTCYWQEVDCTINSHQFYLGSGCWGSFCECP